MPNVSFTIGGKVFDLSPEQVSPLMQFDSLFSMHLLNIFHLYVYSHSANISANFSMFVCWISTFSKWERDMQLNALVDLQL